MLKLKAKFSGFSFQKTSTQLRFRVDEILDMLDFYDLVKKPGWLYFSADEMKFEVEKVMKDRSIGADETHRSPSQRLRGALFQFWLNRVQKDGEVGEFDEWYKAQMERLIKQIKEQT